ncbi:MAG: hypothetical protein M3153_07480 [Chloroflexota bacterium]|nr:hypothetical protein [Chloroflexota bacterium]
MTVGVATVAAPPAAAAPSPVSVDVVADGVEPGYTVDAATGLATATYAITATNAGPSSLTHGVLTGDGSVDATAATNVFTSAEGNVPISCEGGTTLKCKFLAEWKPGTVTVRVSFTFPVDDVDLLTYNAKVSGYSQTRSGNSKSSFVDVPASETTTVQG